MRWLLALMIVAAGPAWAEEGRIDAAGTMVESHPNPAAANPGGAGPTLARWLAEKKVGTLIAGDFGAKLMPALDERKISAVKASGPAAQAAKEARR